MLTFADVVEQKKCKFRSGALMQSKHVSRGKQWRRVLYQVWQKSVVSSVTGKCCIKCDRRVFYQVLQKSVTGKCWTKCGRRVFFQVLQKSVVSSVTGKCFTKCYRRIFYQVFTEVVPSVTEECCIKCDRGCHQQTTSVALSPRRAVERRTCCTALNFATPEIWHCKNIVTLRILEYKCWRTECVIQQWSKVWRRRWELCCCFSLFAC